MTPPAPSGLSGPSSPVLSVNLDKVALLRNQRDMDYPDPVAAGRTVLEAGAGGLTAHPRPDARHIRVADIHNLRALLVDEGWRAQGREFNVEGYPNPEFLSLMRDVRPDQVTLVPDGPDVRTSDTGWDVFAHAPMLADAIGELTSLGCRVALFMNAEADATISTAAMDKVAELGADRVELYTGPWAMAHLAGTPDAMQEIYGNSARDAAAAGLGINAGHDLTCANLPALRRVVPGLAEVSIGHALIADALWFGLAGAVQRYLGVLA